MSKIISIHSFRGGTGKSNVTANLASLLAQTARVGIIDTDIQSPGVHVLLNFDQKSAGPMLNNYLWGECRIEEAVYDVTESLGNVQGALYLVPSSIESDHISRVLRDGYDVSLLTDSFHELPELMQLDYLLIDTHPGVNEETLLSIAISDVLILMMRPDRQDFQGTAVTMDLALRLDVPEIVVGMNKVPPAINAQALREHVAKTLGGNVGCVLPLNFEMAELGSSGLFVQKQPQHPWSRELKLLAQHISQS